MCAMARPRKPLLSTERIVDTARALVDAEGLAALSTRLLAAELGVSGPSLYNHFRTKDEILEAVADSVSAQVDLSMFEDGRDWRADMTSTLPKVGLSRNACPLSDSCGRAALALQPWLRLGRCGYPSTTWNSVGAKRRELT